MVNRTWRTVLWREGAEHLTTLAARLESPVAPRGAGWEVRGSRGAVAVRGGIQGTRTILWRADGTKRVEPGWMNPEDAVAWIASS